MTLLVGLALLAAFIAGVARVCLGGEGQLMSGLFRAPDLGWPHGVQEEDAVAWNWDDAAAPTAAPASVLGHSTIVEPLAFRLRPGSARRDVPRRGRGTPR